MVPDQLTYRFVPRAFPTDAVFTTDVDMAYDCHALEYGLRVWQSLNVVGREGEARGGGAARASSGDKQSKQSAALLGGMSAALIVCNKMCTSKINFFSK